MTCTDYSNGSALVRANNEKFKVLSIVKKCLSKTSITTSIENSIATRNGQGLGRCITAMFRKFHPEHFVCAFCLKQLNKGTFKEQNDKPYCYACFEKLFG